MGAYYQWGRNKDVTNGSVVTGPVATDTTNNFITNSSGTNSYDWLTSSNNNLWGGTTTSVSSGLYSTVSSGDKTLMQGPCASGYHVPTQKEWCDAAQSINPSLTCTSSWQNDTSLRTTLKLPLAGYRNYADGVFYNQSSYGYYWTASPNGSYGYGLNLNSSQVSPVRINHRSYGFSVRCLKN